MLTKLFVWLHCRNGTTAIEYALIAAGISLAILVAVFAFGDDMQTLLYDDLAGALEGP